MDSEDRRHSVDLAGSLAASATNTAQCTADADSSEQAAAMRDIARTDALVSIALSFAVLADVLVGSVDGNTPHSAIGVFDFSAKG